VDSSTSITAKPRSGGRNPPTEIWDRTGLTHEERERIDRAIKEERGELVEDETLRRCYDYLQAARRKQDESALHELYKAVEAVEHRLGGESKAIEALKVEMEIKFVKRVANEGVKDARHAPKPDDLVQRVTGVEIGKATECTYTIVRAYERYLGDKVS
jgi:hypothetical protein